MMVVKICDIRTEEAAELCVQAGASMLGLHCIWAPLSPERMQLFRGIMGVVRGRASCVMVTRETNINAVAQMAKALAWDYIQLHSSVGPRDIRWLRGELISSAIRSKIIGVVEASNSGIGRAEEIVGLVDLLLVDSSIRGGTGALADPVQILRVKDMVRGKLLIAGGLRPDNVCEIIQRFRPYGVDVQSGVERPDGSRVKDPDLVHQFLSAVYNCPD